MKSLPERSTETEHSVDRSILIPLTGDGAKTSRAVCRCGWQTEWVADDERGRASQDEAATAHGADVGCDVFAEGHARAVAATVRLLQYGAAARARRLAAAEQSGAELEPIAKTAPPAPAPKRKRQPKTSPARLAKWEAHWQAEHSAEAER